MKLNILSNDGPETAAEEVGAGCASDGTSCSCSGTASLGSCGHCAIE